MIFLSEAWLGAVVAAANQQPDLPVALRGLGAPVAFDGCEAIPFVVGRKSKAVSPIGIVGHDASARGPANERPQRDHYLDDLESLEISV